MIKTLAIQGNTIEYTQKISSRGRTLRLSIYHDGRVMLTVPKQANQMVVEKFLMDKSDWILKKVDYSIKHPRIVLGGATASEFASHKDSARTLVQSRLTHFNQLYGFAWKSITIRNQSTRWGSCSKQGNLSFNYKIVQLPSELCDYIIVHELCHLKELNHSPKFWKQVERAMPAYKLLRKKLKSM
jgi:predicted metal-dependent hydrolase